MAKQPKAVLEEEKNIIYGYSERGIINSLIFTIGEDKELLKKFISLISIPNKIEIGEPEKYTILLEQSFSRFGDSDLVIIIHYKKPEDKKVLFFEGKVKTSQGKWKIDSQFSKYNKPEQYKGYSSNLFFQLYLKKLLIDYSAVYKNEKVEKGIKEPKFNEIRKIGNNKIVLEAFDKLKYCKEDYYIGLIPTSKDNVENFTRDKENFIDKIDYKLHFLSWETVYEFCINHELEKVLKIFKYNQGQIY